MSVDELPESMSLDHIPVHVGIIGGSGLYNLDNLTVVSVFFTPFEHTDPSSLMTERR